LQRSQNEDKNSSEVHFNSKAVPAISKRLSPWPLFEHRGLGWRTPVPTTSHDTPCPVPPTPVPGAVWPGPYTDFKIF
jgi:hypothetical protein